VKSTGHGSLLSIGLREEGSHALQNVFKNAPVYLAQQGPDGPLLLPSHSGHIPAGGDTKTRLDNASRKRFLHCRKPQHDHFPLRRLERRCEDGSFVILEQVQFGCAARQFGPIGCP
jgi:hypothetical protein